MSDMSDKNIKTSTAFDDLRNKREQSHSIVLDDGKEEPKMFSGVSKEDMPNALRYIDRFGIKAWKIFRDKTNGI